MWSGTLSFASSHWPWYVDVSLSIITRNHVESTVLMTIWILKQGVKNPRFKTKNEKACFCMLNCRLLNVYQMDSLVSFSFNTVMTVLGSIWKEDTHVICKCIFVCLKHWGKPLIYIKRRIWFSYKIQNTKKCIVFPPRFDQMLCQMSTAFYRSTNAFRFFLFSSSFVYLIN